MISLVLDHLWQSSLFLAAAGLITLALNHNSAGARFWLWFSASVKFLVPFALLTALGSRLLILILPPVSAPAVTRMQPLAQPFSDPVFVAGPAIQTAPHAGLAFLLAMIWASGFTAIVLRWLVRWARMRALLRDAVDAGITAPIAVRLAPSRLEPGLVGIFKPVILLPRGIAGQLTQEELSAILAHELCHWRRHDNLLAAIHMAVEALFWFFPLVWWLGARLNAERERACDESVLATGNDPEIYAGSILKVCRAYLQSPIACVSGVSGASLKQRMDAIMENELLVRLNIFKKSLLASCAAVAIVAPLSLGLLTAPAVRNLVFAQETDAPHPGTEAALRHQIESMLKDQPDYSAMVPSLAQAARQQYQSGQIDIKKRYGALKSITFRENQNGNDVYLVEFENQSTAWTIGPLQPDGKVGPVLYFGPSLRRNGNTPSPGLEAAIRRELEGALSGNPALEIMSQGLQNATQNQWKAISGNAKALGPVKAITFQKVNARGWDVYHATFANGTETVQAAPLVDGKLTGILHSEVLVPHAPQHAGTEAWMRRHIAGIENGTPNYNEMGPFLTNAVRQQWPDQQPFYKSLGAFQSLAFEGGGGNETDVYVATFQNRKVRWHIGTLDATGKVDVLFFQR